MNEDDVPAGAPPFARSYDAFKHSAGIALLALGGVFAFADGGMRFAPAQLIVICSFIAIAGIASLLMVGTLAALEIEPKPFAQVARKIRIANVIVGASLSGGLGGFTYNFVRMLLK